MSLLDDVSIVVTPNGYKASKLYAVIPSNGDADMDVTRATDATRVNESGLIADVLSNVPRIDYTGGGCPHILSEPQRKNEITYSEDFSQSYWTKARTTVEGGFISPDGTENAYKLIENTAENVHAFYNSTFGVNNGDTYTISLFIKYNGRQWFRLWGQFGSSNKEAYFDIENGLLGQKDSGLTSKIEDYGNDWYRISASATSDGTNGRFRGYLAIDDGDSFYQGDGTSGAFIWGAQYEEGSYETSYIPTSGITVTRNQDIFTRDGIGSLINSTEGVLFVEMAALVDGGNFELISLSDGSNSNRCSVFFNGGNLTAAYRISNSNVFIHIEASDLLNFNKVAISYKQSQFKMFVNGYNVFEQLSGNVLPSNTFNKLSFDSGAGANPFYGKVKQLQVYNTALTDTELATLTT